MKISPQWQTPSTEPVGPPVTEGDTINRALSVISVGEDIFPYVEYLTVPLNVAGSVVEQVWVNGVLLPSSRISPSGRNIILDLASLNLSGSVTVRVQAATPEITLLRGTLPPGLSLQNGAIVGLVNNLSGLDDLVFRFTLRAKYANVVRDRVFTMNGVAVSNPSVWVINSLPPSQPDGVLGISFHNMGAFDRAAPFQRSLESEDPDGIPAPPEILSHGLNSTLINDGLPPGLKLVGNTIRGNIDPACPPGRYMFRIGFVGQTTSRVYCEIRVNNALAQNATNPVSITWMTPKVIGTLHEGYPSDLAVVARHITPVQYSLAPGSLPLPPGLILLPNGQIRGVAPHVDRDSTFRIRVRATAKNIYDDREFEVVVHNRYNSDAILDVRFRMSLSESSIATPIYAATISDSDVFRGGDNNFGLQASPSIYLVKGLKPVDLAIAMQGDGSQGVISNDYHGTVKLSLGWHAYAVCRDADQKIKYEVVYREVHDPLAKAGGFRFGTDTVVEEKVAWPQSPPGQVKYIYPRSLRNIRYDFIKDIGFATSDARVRLSGPTGVEGLPEWMMSRQVAEDPSSVPGFVPALVICYVRPGRGAAVAKLLNETEGLPEVGHTVRFDRYHLYEHSPTTETTFDEGTTFFDVTGFGRIVFDSEENLASGSTPAGN